MDRVGIVFTQMVSPFGLFPRLFSNAYYYYLVQSQPLIPPQSDLRKKDSFRIWEHGVDTRRVP